MNDNVEKREVEELLGCTITDEQFEEALKYTLTTGIWSSRLMKPLRKSIRHPAGEVPAGTQRGRRQGTGVNSAGQKLTTEFMAIQ